MAESKRVNHLPVIVLIALFAIVFLISLMLFQVATTEVAVVKRFGKPVASRSTEPGLHFRLPWPIEDVWRMDKRLQIFEGQTGIYEEIGTRDEKNIIVMVFVGWQVNPAAKEAFMNRLGTKERAETQLNSLLSNIKRNVLQDYTLEQLIHMTPTDGEAAEPSAQSVHREVEQGIMSELQAAAAEFGIDIRFVGIKHLGLPESVTQEVIARMKQDRQKEAEITRSRAETEAKRIVNDAETERQRLIAEGRSAAIQIRAKADQEAARHYQVFKNYEDLAMFLRKLESLRNTLRDQTTLVFDTDTPPFDLFKKGAVLELPQAQAADANE